MSKKKKKNMSENVRVVKIPFKRCSETNPQTFDEGVSIQLFSNPPSEIIKTGMNRFVESSFQYI